MLQVQSQTNEQKHARCQKQKEFHRFDLAATSVIFPAAAFVALTGYLDRAESLEAAKHVCELLEEMQELEKIEPPIFTKSIGNRPMMVTRGGVGVANPIYRKIEPENYKRQRKIEARNARINKELSQYRFVPFIFPIQQKWQVGWRIVSPRQENKIARQNYMTAGVALHMILDIAKAGDLNRLRRCAYCCKWVYAAFKHQTFCSASCQQAHYRHSDEWRKKRRDYMRRYRAQNF